MKIINQSFECVTPLDHYIYFDREIEKCARVCYKSEDKITKGSSTILLNKLVHDGHSTMLEFCDLIFKFTVDTKIASALGRHRLSTQAHESTHYIDYAKKGELVFIRQVEENPFDSSVLADLYEYIEQQYFSVNMPHTLKRCMLPFALKTELNMKANIAEWRHILKLRSRGNDHPQMTALMKDLLKWFKQELPMFVEDIDL
jgi:thymidylate synthase (FAD)